VIFYNDDFTKIKSIIPITTTSLRIFEENDNIFCQFTWAYDKKTYTVPYSSVIHLKARYSKKRFLGTEPDDQLKNSLELLDVTGQGLRNIVKNSANLKGYLKYNNFIDDDELKAKVKEFQTAYMDASNEGGLAGLDNSADFKEIAQRTPIIPTGQSQFLRDNIFRYYNLNDKILMSTFSESEWNAFYESVIEPIAIQLSLEFTYKVLTERERGFGNKITFNANRLQYATLQTRVAVGKDLYDRGTITINELRELMYYEPIEGGDVRMVSLNYVKADEQSIYQVGAEGSDAKENTGQQAKVLTIYKMAIPTAIRKGGE
jgi:HK97 family phage portal protein